MAPTDPALIPWVPDSSTSSAGDTVQQQHQGHVRNNPVAAGASPLPVALRDGTRRPGTGTVELGTPGMFSTCPWLCVTRSARKDKATSG